MNRIGTLLGLVSALAMGGCDNGPSLNVVPEPAGANCPTGGFRVEADGEVFYSCNGQATTETVAAGAEGNPCLGDALRVTIPVEGGGTQFAYVCQPIEADPVAAGYLTFQLDAIIAQGNLSCACTDDVEARAQCESMLSTYESIAHLSEGCVAEVLTVAGPLPEADRPAVECLVNAVTMAIDCLESIPTAECTMETEAEIAACQELGAGAEACAETSDALDTWRSTVGKVSQFLGCPLFPGGV